MEKIYFHIIIKNHELRKQIRKKEICFAGNKNLKIFGTLHCQSGKRMKKENCVFFKSAEHAQMMGYRPCGHCMNNEYKIWKNQIYSNT